MNEENKKKPENKKEPEKKNKYIIYYIIIIALLLAIVVIGGVLLMNNKKQKDENTIAYTDLIQKIDKGEIEKVEMTVGSTSIEVKLKEQEEKKKAIIPSTQAFVELVQEKKLQGNSIELIQKEQNAFLVVVQYIYSAFPMIMILVLFLLIMKMQGLGDKGKLYDAETTKSKIKFEDVAGLDEEKAAA